MSYKTRTVIYNFDLSASPLQYKHLNSYLLVDDNKYAAQCLGMHQLCTILPSLLLGISFTNTFTTGFRLPPFSFALSNFQIRIYCSQILKHQLYKLHAIEFYRNCRQIFCNTSLATQYCTNGALICTELICTLYIAAPVSHQHAI